MESKTRRKQRIGIVTSDKMDKTIVVRINRITKHPVYRRIVRRSNTIMAHDPNKQAKAGDKVRIQEARPISGNKRWCLIEVLKAKTKD